MIFGWGDRKMEGLKTLLFCWKEKWKDRKCDLYKFTIMPLLDKKKTLYFYFFKKSVWMSISLKKEEEEPKYPITQNK